MGNDQASYRFHQTPALRLAHDDDDPEAEAAIAIAAPPVAALPKLAVVNDGEEGSRGYQWKQLFLPNGTELRSIFCGRSVYAKVEDEQIISDGLPITPSRFANGRGCGTRSAWKTVWLRFPGTKRWELAARSRDAQMRA